MEWARASIQAVNVQGTTYVGSSKPTPTGWAEEDLLNKVLELENGLLATTWVEYVRFAGLFWQVTVKEPWNKTTCTCPSFLKCYVCKHSVGVCLRRRLCSAPPEAKAKLFGVKRKRGRPAKAKPALVRD